MSRFSAFRRLFRYLTASILGTAADLFFLWLYTLFVESYSATYIIGPVFSFQIAMLINFTASCLWIWPDRIPKGQKHHFWKRFLSYDIAAMMILGVKMILIILLERLTGWGVLLCNLIALTVTGVLNFFIRERLIFSPGSFASPLEIHDGDGIMGIKGD
jgi:putative flippase GtrA